MRFRGVLVRPLADQGDRDGTFIDPTGVAFIEGRDYPLTVEFDMERAVGYAVVSRAEDGSLWAEGAVTETDPAAIMSAPPRLAAGINIDRYSLAPEIAATSESILPGRVGRVVANCRLNAVALTADHSDPGQPPIEEVKGE